MNFSNCSSFCRLPKIVTKIRTLEAVSAENFLWAFGNGMKMLISVKTVIPSLTYNVSATENDFPLFNILYFNFANTLRWFHLWWNGTNMLTWFVITYLLLLFSSFKWIFDETYQFVILHIKGADIIFRKEIEKTKPVVFVIGYAIWGV